MKRRFLFWSGPILLFMLLCARAQGAEPLWTWVKGDNHVLSGTGSSYYRDNGVYGTRGVPASTNTPGARQYPAAWTGKDGRLWLFGGSVWIRGREYSSPQNFNDLWRYDPAMGNWTWVKGSNTTNQDGVYGTQGVAVPANTPGAREGAASWTDPAGRLWLFGGYRKYFDGGSFAEEYYNDLWRFDPATGNWTWVKGSNKTNRSGAYGSQGVEAPTITPGARYRSVAWTDKAGLLWLFGGSSFPSSYAYYNDLWRFNPVTGNWAWFKGSTQPNQIGDYGTQGIANSSNTPGPRSGATGWIDKSGGLWLFGGYGLDSAMGNGTLNDLWRFDPAAENWTWVKGSNKSKQTDIYSAPGKEAPENTPGGRYVNIAWIDSWGRFWLYGGRDAAVALHPCRDDLWRFDPVTRNWAWVKGSHQVGQLGVYGMQGTTDPANTPGNRIGAAAWVGADGRLWLFGGFGYGFDPRLNLLKEDGMFNDLWSLTVPKNAVPGAAWRGLE